MNNMNYENFKQGFNKPTIITAQQYGTKVSVEIDHSDTDIDELFDAFQTIIVGLGYHESAWKQWIIDRADEYREEDEEELYKPNQALREAAERYKANVPKQDEFLNLRHSGDNFEDYQNKND